MFGHAHGCGEGGVHEGIKKRGDMGSSIGSVPGAFRQATPNCWCYSYSESSLALELSSELLSFEEVEAFELLGTEKTCCCAHIQTTPFDVLSSHILVPSDMHPDRCLKTNNGA